MKALLEKFIIRFLLGGLVALLLAWGVTCLSLSYEKRAHKETNLELEAAQRSLRDAQQQLKRIKHEQAINEDIKEQLIVTLEETFNELQKIQTDSSRQLAALRQEMETARRAGARPPPNEQEEEHEEVDYGQRAADILLDGMWEAYRSSLRDPPDRP